jgi:hypothetical protein
MDTLLTETVDKLRSNLPKDETPTLSVETREILAKFETEAELEAENGKGYAKLMTLTLDDFDMSKVSYGVGITNLQKDKFDAYYEACNTTGLKVYAIPFNITPNDVRIEVYATWSDNTIDEIMYEVYEGEEITQNEVTLRGMGEQMSKEAHSSMDKMKEAGFTKK